MASHYRRSTLANHVLKGLWRHVQGTGDLYSAQCQFRRRRHLPANEPQKQCMETRSCEDRDVSELCRFAEKALVTRMSCQTVLNTSGVQVYRTILVFLWSSNGRRIKSPVKWTNSHCQCQLVGDSFDSDHERAMRNRLDDANTSEACIIDFRSESNLNTRTGMLWQGVSPDVIQ